MAGGSYKVTEPSLRLIERLSRITQWVLLLAIAAACVIILQKSFHFVSTTPFLNVDDSIPNVAVSLAEHGRYGFLSSPTQGLNEVDRTHAFFNYGPLYFVLAAALTWLLGPSLELYRMLHPAGLVFIILGSLWVFRRVSLVGTAVLAVLLFHMYLVAQWPLARPDIMVSICAVLMLIFAAKAIEKGGWLNWFAMGFFAAGAVTTHQIAAAMIPAAGVIWAWSIFTERRDGGARFGEQVAISFAALFLGGAAGVFVYLKAIDFRLRDLLSLGAAYNTSYHMPYRQALRGHFDYAWSSLSPSSLELLVAGFCAAVLLAIGGSFLSSVAMRRRILALVMPPVVGALFYQLSVGFYGNFHTGYVIVTQVTTIWAVSAMLAVGIAYAQERAGQRRLALETVAMAGAIWVVATASVSWALTPSVWQNRAVGNVDISDYIRQVEAPLPERAAAWGSLYFGLDAGNRTDLVQFIQMPSVMKTDFQLKQRLQLAPDFLLLGSYELDTDSIRSIAGYDTQIEGFGRLFSGIHYRLANLVYAPPYGVTREYERFSEPVQDAKPALPTLAVNDGTGRQWSSALSPPLEVKFSPAQPVTANASIYSLHPERAAYASLMADLPPGFFLIDVDLERTDPSRIGFVLATPGRYFYWRGGWTDFSMPVAPYLAGEKNVWVLVDHLGGPLYLSRFENSTPGAGGFGIRVASIRRVSVLNGQSHGTEPLHLSAWETWRPLNVGYSSRPDGQGNLRLAGYADSDEWLVQSPPITVRQHERFTLTLPTEPISGGVEIGVMGTEGWLSSPTLMPRRIVFDTGASASVTVVIANSGLGRSKPLDVLIRSGTMTSVVPQSEYVDQLMGCRSPYIHVPGLDCAKK